MSQKSTGSTSRPNSTGSIVSSGIVPRPPPSCGSSAIGASRSSHVVAVKLDLDGRPPIHGSARASTHRAAADEIIDLLERRAVDQKERLREPDHPGAPSARSTPTPEPADGSDDSRRVVKVKRFALEPMFEEDAVARMEELGHSFFVFVNAEDERVNVLYRRRDGDYGLIEPVVGGEYAVGRVRRRA